MFTEATDVATIVHKMTSSKQNSSEKINSENLQGYVADSYPVITRLAGRLSISSPATAVYKVLQLFTTPQSF